MTQKKSWDVAECDVVCSEEVRCLLGTTSMDWWAKRLGRTPPREELRMWQNAYREVYFGRRRT